jgi:hypothetical protein
MAETLARSLIRLIVTVVILAAVYIFIVRPILDTTESTFDKAFSGIQTTIDDAFQEVGVEPPDLTGDSRTDAQKLLACVKRVQPNTKKMQRCAKRYHAKMSTGP